MPSYKDNVRRYRRKSRMEAKHNARERELANKIHELEQKLLFAEQPFKTEIGFLKIAVENLKEQLARKTAEVTDMLLWCPECHDRHIDVGEFETKVHHTHACQHCGHCWRPAIAPTRGVRFLPGFKNRDEAERLIGRLAELRGEIAVVGNSDRPAQIVDQIIAMVKK